MAIIKYTQIMLVDNYSGLPSSADIGQLAMDISTNSTYQWNGSSWLPLGRVIIKKEMNSINAKNTGNTLIYTLEASGLNFYPFGIVPRATGVGISGVTLGPSISVGSNSTAYDNIASASLLGNVLSALTGGNSLSSSVNSPALAGGTAIYAKVSVGAVATNYTLKYDILGYYDT